MNDDDQELSRLAAKACGFELGDYRCLSSMPDDYLGAFWIGGEAGYYWNPLEHEGDALRLAVKLGFVLNFGVVGCRVTARQHVVEEAYAIDLTEKLPTLSSSMSAVCRAIVRAAAEIGKNTIA